MTNSLWITSLYVDNSISIAFRLSHHSARSHSYPLFHFFVKSAHRLPDFFYDCLFPATRGIFIPLQIRIKNGFF